MERDLIDLLHTARAAGGSDLHICADLPPAARVDGVLVPLSNTELSAAECRELIHAVLTEPERTRLERDWELDFALQIRDLGRFRGNAHYVRGHAECSLRYIPDTVPELEDLGHGHAAIQLATLKQGLVVVAGVAGMGKSSTLAALTRRILKTRSAIVVTIEDPIEYVHRHSYGVIKQRQLGQDTHSFGAAIKTAVRQDVDVIVVAEMRDQESIQAAISAAETGHLVITTLHTPDAVRTLDRIVDVFPPDHQQQINTQLSGALAAVVCQRLLPREGGGRVLASEILLTNDAVRACIREKRYHQLQGLIQIGRAQGMHTLDECLAQLLVAGQISLESALEHARDGEMVKATLQEHLRQQAILAAQAAKGKR